MFPPHTLKQGLALGEESVNPAISHVGNFNNLPNTDKVPKVYNRDARCDIYQNQREEIR
jgi:hypothetical protein